MKKIFISLSVVVALVASTLALVASVATSASAADDGSIIILRNATTTSQERVAEGDARIMLTLRTLSGCQPAPGRDAPAEPIVLGRGDTSRELVQLDPNCDWEFLFAHATGRCIVEAKAIEAEGDTNINTGPVDEGFIGAPIYAQRDGSIIIRGIGDNFRYGTDFEANNNVVQALRFNIVNDRNACVRTFDPTVTIAVPGGSTDAARMPYAGQEFTVEYNSDRAGCGAVPADTQTGSATYRIGADGSVSLATGEGYENNNAPELIHQTLADLAAIPNPPDPSDAASFNGYEVGDNRCTYTASFTSANPALTLTSVTLTEGGAAANKRPVINGGTVVGGGNFAGDSTTRDADPPTNPDITATYTTTTVDVVLTTVYPEDELFHTTDTVGYAVEVQSPCGGFADALPAGFASGGDHTSIQVFPGAATIYGSVVNQALVTPEVFTTVAYNDRAGTTPCTVSVTEQFGPDRCPPASGPVQSQTYSPGTTALTFVFNHSCTPTAEAGDDTPPTPDPGGDTDGPPADEYTG